MPVKNFDVPPTMVGCYAAINQCRALIAHLNPEHYRFSAAGKSSIGGHMRHVVEHFTCFLDGLPTGEVCYDRRQRDLTLEQDPVAVDAVLARVESNLRLLESADLKRPLLMFVMPGPDQPEESVQSNIQRELLFVAHHAIHHLAIMKMQAEQIAPGQIPDDLGVAWSTLAYRQSQH